MPPRSGDSFGYGACCYGLPVFRQMDIVNDRDEDGLSPKQPLLSTTLRTRPSKRNIEKDSWETNPQMQMHFLPSL